MLLSLALLACTTTPGTSTDTPEPPPRDTGVTSSAGPVEQVPGAPLVAAAEGDLVLPIGTPLGGYTARCWCMLGFSHPDGRDSHYANGFATSAGVQTYPTIKVMWVANGDDHLVITKTDSIYSYDGLVQAVTDRLERRLGVPLQGRVIHTTNHSHNSYGTFSDAPTFYLGGDTMVRENFERMADQIADVAVEAHGELQPGRIGVGWAKDWDPTDSIYSDRRGENDDLAVWDDVEPGMGKDPHLGIVRLDDLDGNPLGVIVNFGMHGIIGGESNPLVSGDSGAHLETYLEESFDDEVVVMFAQGSGGDASPRGKGEGFARMESIGALGVDLIRPVIDQTPTGSDPISLETVSRHIPVEHDSIRVTRNGAVDWSYAPYDPERAPDDIVYDSEGELITPIDEFNVPYGGLFCGSDAGLGAIVNADIGSEAPEYASCVDVAGLIPLVEYFFDLEEDSIPLPLPESQKAGTTVSRLGPVPTLLPDGSEVVEDLLVGFFPGEATAMYGEQWRRRVRDELGDQQAMMISYAQDHEGYLLIPEDWLMGGYEPDITVWGPLAAEHTMEGVLQAADEVLATSVREDPDPEGLYAPTTYPDRPLEVHAIDPTPAAGTRLTVPPEHLWTWHHPDGIVPADELVIPAELPRVQGVVQLAWEGGDPAVDNPKVWLERLDGSTWNPVTSATGRPVTEADHDILLAHTPFPLAPSTDAQSHRYWAAWQAVGHVHDRSGLPEGTYRLRVEGQRFVGTETTWPFTTEAYEVVGEAFELVPAALDLAWDGVDLTVSLPAPALGWRLVDLDGSSVGDNPLRGELQVVLHDVDGATEEVPVTPTVVGQRSRLEVDLTDVVQVDVVDAYGNAGTILGPFTAPPG